jgi:hypothetical protein
MAKEKRARERKRKKKERISYSFFFLYLFPYWLTYFLLNEFIREKKRNKSLSCFTFVQRKGNEEDKWGVCL